MKLLHRHKTHTGGIQLKLFLETHDDLWFLYNIAFKGDLIEGFTSRKIKTENCNSICVKQEIKKFTIRLCIESVQYTTSYDDIHVTGTNVLENPYVKIGQYHTLDVQPNSTITLFKEEWNKLCEDKLSHILNVSMNAEQAFLVSFHILYPLQVIDNGRASFFLLSQYMTKEVFKLIHNIPIRKTSSHRSSNSSKSSESFYRMILDKIDSELDFKVLRMVVITGPGIFKDLFFEYMKANSLNLNAINEVLSNPLLSSKLNYVFYHDHNKVLDELKTRLEMNDEKVCFGFDDIYNAVTLGAVESILVSDNVIREASSTTRRKIHELVDEVKHYGGGVYYFSDNHCATEYIKNLTGLVALLRFVI
uniref:Eukaryotic peptide chain release factor subunit 1 n=1 Tax=Theileria parva TaxID=5875 RepID=Q4N5D5_THEPA|eukprot:XP_764921.1 pelota protein [Theileria parva strain Muguga]